LDFTIVHVGCGREREKGVATGMGASVAPMARAVGGQQTHKAACAFF
jgi:hypothetical protein